MSSPSTGEPTHAVFGITGMLLKLWAQYKPDYVVVAWDTPGKTFRDTLFTDYKATRSPTPEDLKAQIPRIRELFDGFGIPVLGREGLEADDIVACLVEQLKALPENEDLNIRIVSKDKDLEQLLRDGVTMFDVHTDHETTVADLWESKGITPKQVIDLLALTGDTVDNVPGVAGVGPKTAVQLIQQYGSVDEIIAHAAELKGKLRERVETSVDNLLLSRELVTLHCSSDLDFSLESARFQPSKIDQLIALFRNLGFNRYQDELRRLVPKVETKAVTPPPLRALAPVSSLPVTEKPFDLWSFEDDGGSVEQPSPSLPIGQYREVTTLDELHELAIELGVSEILALAVQTPTISRKAEAASLSFSTKEGTGWTIALPDSKAESLLSRDTIIGVLKPILEDEEIAKCGHDLKPACIALRRCGIAVSGIVFDSGIASNLLEPTKSRRIEDLAQERIGVSNASKAWSSAETADISLRLYHQMSVDLADRKMSGLMRDIEGPLIESLAEMETNGILCDPVELRKQGAELALRAEALKTLIFQAAGLSFELGSTRQVAEVLFEKLKLPAGKKTKTGYSTDVEVLEKLATMEDADIPHTAVPRLILEYRQLTKLISTYLGNLVDAIDPTDGRIYTTFVQLAAATGRLGSNNPNLQNIPIRTSIGKQIRKAFIAPEGSCLISADYSQIELRLLAHLSGDPALLRAFASGEDVHSAVAAEVFDIPLSEVTKEQRGQAKMINYAIVYGVTPFGLSRRIEGLNVGAASDLISRYRRNFSGVDVFLQECIEQAKTNGYVATIYGRRRPIPEIESRQSNLRQLGERLAINSVVQGSAADLIKKAMVDLLRRIRNDHLPLKLLLQIHDELVLECPETEAEEMGKIVVQAMEQAMTLSIPLTAECGIAADWMNTK